jgi:vitamin-K-epoxide reductase (warfarin-sensitive)
MLNYAMRGLLALLAVAGLTVSILALHVHNMDPSEAPPCAVTEQWDCGTVNHSRYAVFPARTFDEAPGTFHIPVATLGIAGYSVMILVAFLGWFRLLLPMALGGFGVASYLTYLEAQVIHKWCIYCVCSQTIVTILLLTTLAAILTSRRNPRLTTQNS